MDIGCLRRYIFVDDDDENEGKYPEGFGGKGGWNSGKKVKKKQNLFYCCEGNKGKLEGT